MGLRILILLLVLLSSNTKAQYFKLLPADTIFNVDMWTHLSRKQLPDFITPELKDSLYSCQLKKTGAHQVTVYLLEFDSPIDSQIVTCKFQNDHITFEKHREFRGNPFIWGIATLRRKMYFTSVNSVRYKSTTKSRKFLFFVWPGTYKKQEVDRNFDFLNLWGN